MPPTVSKPEAAGVKSARYRHAFAVERFSLGKVGDRKDDALTGNCIPYAEVEPHSVPCVAGIRPNRYVVLPFPYLPNRTDARV